MSQRGVGQGGGEILYFKSSLNFKVERGVAGKEGQLGKLLWSLQNASASMNVIGSIIVNHELSLPTDYLQHNTEQLNSPSVIHFHHKMFCNCIFYQLIKKTRTDKISASSLLNQSAAPLNMKTCFLDPMPHKEAL